MRKSILLLQVVALSVLVLSCGQPPKQEESAATKTEDVAPEKKRTYPETLAKALEAHGGIDHWDSFGTLEYDLKNSMLDTLGVEHQLIDLYSRKVLLNTDYYRLGFDGKEVWITNREAFGRMSPRFYHNLIFYFFGIPYLLADPGINYEDLGRVNVAGKPYDAVKITYNQGVGDSAEDIYIPHFNPETHELELLLYTVTYGDRGKNENYNALLYDNWQTVNGLKVPKTMKGYKYENDSLTTLRYSSEFENVVFKTEVPEASIFEMPEGAVIDSLK